MILDHPLAAVAVAYRIFFYSPEGLMKKHNECFLSALDALGADISRQNMKKIDLIQAEVIRLLGLVECNGEGTCNGCKVAATSPEAVGALGNRYVGVKDSTPTEFMNKLGFTFLASESSERLHKFVCRRSCKVLAVALRNW
jgi:hypothetical protein